MSRNKKETLSLRNIVRNPPISFADSIDCGVAMDAIAIAR